ncbi:MAG: Nramp family divalent metal transporter [Telluria sp.]
MKSFDQTLVRMRRVSKRYGPGLITGAADDDPSGIATYSQAGAQFGYGLLWSLVLLYPLMVTIQYTSARLGHATGRGLAANLRLALPRWMLMGLVAALLVANILNIGADLAAMAQGVVLLVGGPGHVYALAFGALIFALQVWLPYTRYVRWLKWLTLSLFAYIAAAFSAHIDWHSVLHQVLVPDIHLTQDYATLLIAVIGTTISPYLFFWQAAQEAEESGHRPAPRGETLRSAALHLKRIRIDTLAGMAASQVVAFFIMLTTAATLHRQGLTDIATTAQAAEALRPLAGESAALLFSLGVIGTGLLAVPVLAGSAAYATAEAMNQPAGFDHSPRTAKLFYLILLVAMGVGAAMDFLPIDPIRALVWSAVINGVVAVPIMAAMLWTATRPDIMGKQTIGRRVRWLGWLAVGVMTVSALFMFFEVHL